MTRGRKAKVDARGRNPNGRERFARLDHKLLRSAAYSSLPPAARALLVELTAMENGNNNGSLWLSVRDATDRLGMSDLNAASAAIDQLEDRGFIAMTRDSQFRGGSSGQGQAHCLILVGKPY